MVSEFYPPDQCVWLEWSDSRSSVLCNHSSPIPGFLFLLFHWWETEILVCFIAKWSRTFVPFQDIWINLWHKSRAGAATRVICSLWQIINVVPSLLTSSRDLSDVVGGTVFMLLKNICYHLIRRRQITSWKASWWPSNIWPPYSCHESWFIDSFLAWVMGTSAVALKINSIGLYSLDGTWILITFLIIYNSQRSPL